MKTNMWSSLGHKHERLEKKHQMEHDIIILNSWVKRFAPFISTMNLPKTQFIFVNQGMHF